MKIPSHTVKFIFVLALGVMAGLAGCGKDLPVAPGMPDSLGTQQGLHFINLLQPAQLFKDQRMTRTDSSQIVFMKIRPEKGGKLQFKMRGSSANENEVFIKVKLDVPHKAVEKKVDISLEINESSFLGSVNMYYSPHGLVFRKPAILNLEASGLDLSGIDPTMVDQIDFYYVNQETGLWEPMQRDALIIDLAAGYIKLVNAKLPHFSRYAVAHSQ